MSRVAYISIDSYRALVADHT